MHLTPKDIRSLKSGLHQDLMKLVEHMDALHVEATDFVESYLIFIIMI